MRLALAIGTLRCFVIDVEDIEVGVAFWSEVTGIPQISSTWSDHAYLGYEDEKTWKHEIILHRVPTAKTSDPGVVDVARRLDPGANRAHIDITVEDVDAAIAQIEAIGGRMQVQELRPRTRLVGVRLSRARRTARGE